MNRTAIVIALGLALAATLPAAPSEAQNTRSFVSGHGSDSNPCTLALPCRSFQQAHDQTNAGGEIAILDTAGYGSLTITKAISIVNPGGVEAGIATSPGGTAITINAGPSDAVSLRGLTVEGAGSGGTGIAFNTGQSLTIANCVIRNFTASGIGIAPTAVATIFVTNTVVANNGGHGIYVQPSGNDIGSVEAIFNRVEVYYNGQMGIGLFGNRITGVSFLRAIAVDSVAGHNINGAGYYALGVGTLSVFRSTAFDNVYGVLADAANIAVAQSHLELNPNPWAQQNSGVIVTYGDNYTANEVLPAGGVIFNKH